MDELSRRDVLGATAAASLGSLAGCLGQLVEDDSTDDQGGNGNGDNTGNGNGDGESDEIGGDDQENGGNGNKDDEADAPPEGVAEISIETISADCSSSDDETANAESTDGGVKITGALTAPDPCHGAVIDLASSDLSQNRLSLTVDVDDTSEESCMDCVGLVEYEIPVELEDDVSVNEVSIQHVDGGSFGIAWETSEATPSAFVSDFETVDASCASGDSDSANAELSEGTVSLDGVLTASNPCHEAVPGTVAVEENQLRVEIGVESTLDDDEMCQDCLGAIEYEATVSLGNDSEIDSVHISHSGGETHTIQLEG